MAVGHVSGAKLDGQRFKKCSSCGSLKTHQFFGKSSSSKDGLRCQCKACVKEYNQTKRSLDKRNGKYEAFLKYKRAYRRNNKVSRTERVKSELKSGKMFCSILQSRKWSSAYKKSGNRQDREIAKVANGEMLLCAVSGLKRWPAIGTPKWQSIANPSDVADFLEKNPWRKSGLSAAERHKVRYANDPAFNAKERIRQRIRKKLRKEKYASIIRCSIVNGGESPTLMDQLGYTVQEFTRHFERCFTKGMTWDAFLSGDIHIDHIRPCASFDMDDVGQVRECWSLSNLQPLWAKDNLVKSDKVTVLL